MTEVHRQKCVLGKNKRSCSYIHIGTLHLHTRSTGSDIAKGCEMLVRQTGSTGTKSVRRVARSGWILSHSHFAPSSFAGQVWLVICTWVCMFRRPSSYVSQAYPAYTGAGWFSLQQGRIHINLYATLYWDTSSIDIRLLTVPEYVHNLAWSSGSTLEPDSSDTVFELAWIREGETSLNWFASTPLLHNEHPSRQTSPVGSFLQ